MYAQFSVRAKKTATAAGWQTDRDMDMAQVMAYVSGKY